MDDLLGEDWQTSSRSRTNVLPLQPAITSNPTSLRASPQPSKTSSPIPSHISRPSSTVNGTRISHGDQFGNLLSLKSHKSENTLSIQDRRKQLEEEKRRQQEQTSQLWETLGSGRATPAQQSVSPEPGNAEEDILAAFNRSAPVDRSSHFPPPSTTQNSRGVTPVQTNVLEKKELAPTGSDDDDPFGLGVTPKPSDGRAPSQARLDATDEDILGDLGKPIAKRTTQRLPARVKHEIDSADRAAVDSQERERQDSSLAELVEMGFPVETARAALAEKGGQIQAAVGWLLQQAHEESKQKAKSVAEARAQSPWRVAQDGDPVSAAYLHEEMRSSSATRRQDKHSQLNMDKDPSQMAQEFGNKLFKSANSLWKASQKQMAKTMAEFQQERDPTQPKWMQSTSAESDTPTSQHRPADKPPRKITPCHADVTDEAAMLDAPRESMSTMSQRTSSPGNFDKIPVKVQPHSARVPALSTSPLEGTKLDFNRRDQRATSKLSRQEVEEQSAYAYVSPARRKRPNIAPKPGPGANIDLFNSTPSSVRGIGSHDVTSAKPATPISKATQSQPTAINPRYFPPVSTSEISTSSRHRKAGGDAFKRGDYAAAHESYTAALSSLPSSHPVLIVILSNRALTALKTGDPKAAIADADRALDIIGVGQGANESIDFGDGDGPKAMRDFYGKVLMRKAEALEHLEKWSDAASVWRQAVEAGVGGAVSLKGRDRCERAAAPVASASPKAVRNVAAGSSKFPPAKSLGDSMQRPTLSSAASADAVKKLRAANAAAEKADDEKFALSDQVDAKLTAWKGGKSDNLRALLQSLDVVLWPGAGWKKVGMSDLVMPNKVKIVYMKAIGKVHPDKIPQDATTEQRMVSAAVFAVLNEAWDKFKTDNNL